MDHLAGKRNLWYAISTIVIIPGLLGLIIFGLQLGIDFTGGTNWNLKFDRSIETEEVRAVLEEHGFDGSVVQVSSQDGGKDNVAVINMKELQQGSPEKQELEQALRSQIGNFDELEIVSVGASVGNEISRRAIFAVFLASIGVITYIAFAFRNTQNPALYGIAAIVAMLHDVVVVLGVFAILGKVANVEIDALFVTAILTVIGFSVHDTIVVFDRIRENLARRAAPTFEGIVNYSLAQTVVRSLNTSMTVIFTLMALYLFGGESTKNFVLALLIGVVSGTYSSIFNASQILVSWETGEIQRLFRRLTGKGAGPAMAPSR
ncbi:MAG: preprotein translocase subunit SecF [Thermomicrobiales bacterium]|jgi:preprotein translocase subunit SecF|nr:preprotein translocase subunit SecF [Thermomicrobiales bacterium]MEA2593874.1 preprotein translocase subunit SecF [Thermomicrobiales bacterium]